MVEKPNWSEAYQVLFMQKASEALGVDLITQTKESFSKMQQDFRKNDIGKELNLIKEIKAKNPEKRTFGNDPEYKKLHKDNLQKRDIFRSIANNLDKFQKTCNKKGINNIKDLNENIKPYQKALMGEEKDISLKVLIDLKKNRTVKRVQLIDQMNDTSRIATIDQNKKIRPKQQEKAKTTDLKQKGAPKQQASEKYKPKQQVLKQSKQNIAEKIYKKLSELGGLFKEWIKDIKNTKTNDSLMKKAEKISNQANKILNRENRSTSELKQLNKRFNKSSEDKDFEKELGDLLKGVSKGNNSVPNQPSKTPTNTKIDKDGNLFASF